MEQQFPDIGIKQHRRLSPEKEKRDKLYNCLHLLPRESFQAMAQGMGTQVEPNSLSKWGRGSWASREANAATLHRTKDQGGEGMQREDSGNLRGSPPSVQLSADSTDQDWREQSVDLKLS